MWHRQGHLAWLGTRKKIAYNIGTTTRVRIVAKSNPNMMVTAMEIKNASLSNGIIPKIVVSAAIETGIKRETPESTMA